jgi:coiled-coil domain-containing protein 34
LNFEKENMDASPKRASTPVEDSVLNNTAFSIDSLQIGDSTRSLLSPLYDKQQEWKNELSSRETQCEKAQFSRPSSDDADQSYTSDFDESVTTVKKGKARKESSHSSRSSSSSSSCSSTTKTSKTKQSQSSVNNSESYIELPLSPWEKWLLDKVVEDKKRAEVDKKCREIQKDIEQKDMNEKSEKERRAEVNRKEWLKLKRNEEKIKNELAARLENEKVRQKQEEQTRIQMKAEESYEKWFVAKEKERKAQRKNKKSSEKSKQENELQRKQQSEDAYKLWLDKSKKHQKLKNNHFGYLGGRVTGYYDWTTYPMPSYNNPNPWVSPKVSNRYQTKIKLQNPSPPLLFKDLEQRERKAKKKQKNINMKTTGNNAF